MLVVSPSGSPGRRNNTHTQQNGEKQVLQEFELVDANGFSAEARPIVKRKLKKFSQKLFFSLARAVRTFLVVAAFVERFR